MSFAHGCVIKDTVFLHVNYNQNIYTISNQQTSSSSDPFQKISVDITAYNGQTVYLQLNHVRTTCGGTSWEGDLAVD